MIERAKQSFQNIQQQDRAQQISDEHGRVSIGGLERAFGKHPPRRRMTSGIERGRDKRDEQQIPSADRPHGRRGHRPQLPTRPISQDQGYRRPGGKTRDHGHAHVQRPTDVTFREQREAKNGGAEAEPDCAGDPEEQYQDHTQAMRQIDPIDTGDVFGPREEQVVERHETAPGCRRNEDVLQESPLRRHIPMLLESGNSTHHRFEWLYRGAALRLSLARSGLAAQSGR